MKTIEGVTVDDIINNTSHYRRLLAVEHMLMFKHLNLAAIDTDVLDLYDYSPVLEIKAPDHRLIMWSFFCDYDFMGDAPIGDGPWYERKDICDVMSSAETVGVSTGQYHEFLSDRKADEQPEVISPDAIVGNWHKDHYHYPHPTCLIAMNMHTFTCAARMGNTVVVNLADAYDDCPKHILDYLQGRSYVYTDVCGCDDPPLSAEHPALATHPVTGRTFLCYPGRDGGGNLACVPSDGSVEQWQEYEDWMWEYMNASENQFRFEWEEGDFLIWDNRSCIHNYFGGWELSERVFDRFCIGQEAPSYKA